MAMIVKREKSQILNYLEDSSNLTSGEADLVYVPETEDEVKGVVRDCADKGIPLTVSAGGTGTVGARIPLGGAVLSVERLKGIFSIDKKRKRATLQPGVVIDDFLRTLENEALFYPPFPTERSAFIGGNIGTNASGEYSYRFGPTRAYVHRIKVALSTGEILDIERGRYLADKEGHIKVGDRVVKIPSYKSPSIKNAAGYFSKPGMDLIDLFIGSEGTLGVITEAEVTLIPALPPRFIIVIFLPQESRILDFLREVKWSGEVHPFSLEYFDRDSLEFLRKDFPRIPDCESAMYIEDEEREEVVDSWIELVEKYNPIDTWISVDKKSYETLVEFRHKLPENINEYFRKINSHKVALDIAVPEAQFPELFQLYQEVKATGRVSNVLFGHIGENHLHFNFFPQDEDERRWVMETYEQVVRKAVGAGGTVSAEHGIGKLKHKYLEMMYGREGIAEMARIKREIDPFCIFGLNNIFPENLL
ncbi:MAG: FAD-binding oxidoreductase [Candidatus Latescibacterota bacterium]|nr:MAG: FAD-binding oxidoreductase [Candidatus Latescibacterota bacterium]